MSDITKNILHRIKEVVLGIDPGAELVLFGSRARGDNREDSDWDILILTYEPVTLTYEQKFRHALFDIELEYGIGISTFVYSRQDWDNNMRVTPLYNNIFRDARKI